jgi:hypothetical protein
MPTRSPSSSLSVQAQVCLLAFGLAPVSVFCNLQLQVTCVVCVPAVPLFIWCWPFCCAVLLASVGVHVVRFFSFPGLPVAMGGDGGNSVIFPPT